MFSGTIKRVVVAGAMIGSIFALGGVASIAATAATQQATYVPVQAISHQFGSKAATGYFLQEAGACQVVLMISERYDSFAASHPTAARLRLALEPGQAAALDSEEGQSIDLTCGEDAATLAVRSGATDEVVALTN